VVVPDGRALAPSGAVGAAPALSRGHGPRAPRAPRPCPGLRQPECCAWLTDGRKPSEWALGRASNLESQNLIKYIT